MPPKIAKLAGLGAFAACGGIALLYVLFLLITRPTPTSGLDGTLRFIAWLSVAGVMLALLFTGTTLNIFSMIGIVFLMGLVTKNAILLVDFTNQ